MTSPVLGRLQKVDPRTVWKHEAHNFTPWLADNIAELGRVVGLDLEVVQREKAVGDFSVDILAKDLTRDRMVVIENQLEATNHSHLGQLITYASGLEASVVIWIAPEFRDEHRQALDWLNRGEGVNIEYFGVVLELVAIDNSKPAVSMRLVSAPNDWGRRTDAAKSGEVTAKGAAYQTFFRALVDELRERHKFTNARTAQPTNWISFSSGHTGVTYGASFGRGRLKTELYIDVGDGDENEAILEKLSAEQQQVQAEFGEELSWEPLEKKRACRIACYRDGDIGDSPDALSKYRVWIVERLLRFEKVFGRRLERVLRE